jgi:hypothetical protein
MVEKMKRKHITPISQSNALWISRKIKANRTHKYAGEPELLIYRWDAREMQDNSTAAKRTRN